GDEPPPGEAETQQWRVPGGDLAERAHGRVLRRRVGTPLDEELGPTADVAEWQHGSRAGAHDTRTGAERRAESPVVVAARRRTRVLLAIERCLEGEKLSRVEPEVHPSGIARRLDEERRADEERDRQPDFAGHERAAQPRTPLPGRRARGRLPQVRRD